MFNFDPELLSAELRNLTVVGDDELQTLSSYAVVSGHFALPTLLRIAPPSSIATVLREPRARLLSHYAFWRLSSENAAWQGYPPVAHALRPLDDFLDEPLLADDTDNMVCRLLVGDDDRIMRRTFIAPNDIEGVSVRAVEALRSLGFVGVLELGESMWQGLSHFFGANLTPLRRNRTDELSADSRAPGLDLEITGRTLDLLRARTAADTVVYQHALASVGSGPEHAEHVSAVAYAAELVRLGDLIGISAGRLRARVREVDELRREIQRQEDVLACAEADLVRYRAWLDGIQGSASWRLTAPARAAKRHLKSLGRSVGRIQGP